MVINDWVSALDDLPVQQSESGVFISEIQCLRKRGLPMRVELVNTSGAAIDISGWKMFDKVGGEYCFPSGTSIEANGFAVIAFGKEKRERSVEKKCTYLHYTNEGSEDLFKGLVNECSLVSVNEENGQPKHVLEDYVCWGKPSQSPAYDVAKEGGLWPGGAVYVGTGEPVVGGSPVLLVEGSISRRVYRRSSSKVSDWEPVPPEAVSIGFQNARPSPGLMDVFPDGPVKLRWLNESLYEDEFYQLQISEKKTFRKLFLDEQLRRPEYSPSHAGTGEFYWRVRIISEGREGKWSQVGHYIVAPSEKDENQYLALQYLAQLCGEDTTTYTAKSFQGLWGATLPEGGLVSLIFMEDGTCALTYDEEDFEADLGVWRFVGGYLIAEFDDGDDVYYCALYKGILQVLSEEYLPPMPFSRLQKLNDEHTAEKPFLGHWETTGVIKTTDHVHINIDDNGYCTRTFRENEMSGRWTELDGLLSLEFKAGDKSSSAKAVCPTQDYLLVSYTSPEKITRRFIRSGITFSDRMSLDEEEKPFLGVWELKLPDSALSSIRIEEDGRVTMTEDDQETNGSWTVEGDTVVISLGEKQISAWIVNPNILVVCFEWKKYRYNQTVAFHRPRG
ncbi:MAG: lamin tail domain-containing protein [Pontiellaceae bacterium]|nr:lamin tail domain-containing protein [Pontiellaceae bacterium]